MNSLTSSVERRTLDVHPQHPLPAAYKRAIPVGALFHQVQEVLSLDGLNTVCVSAKCPNRGECFSRGSLAFMILGDVCTRHCGFCAVKTGMPGAMDESEPQRLAQAAKALNLRHVVVTSAARDDLPDGGASVFAECIRQLHRHVPSAVVEVLVPDFNGDTAAINTVMQAAPDIFNHNIETVERLTPLVRSHRAAYRQSLDVLAYAKAYCRRDRMNPAPSRGGVKTKSGLMLGLGETRGEVLQALADLRGAGCEYVTIGQYLQPSAQHLKVQSFVPVSEFQLLREEALRMGFERVASGPLVRSSYFADQLHAPEELS